MSPLRTTLLFPAALLCGCSGLLHSTAPALQLYVLPPTKLESVVISPDGSVPPPVATLRIARPVTAPGLSTDRIALANPGNRLDYFAGARWSAPLADLMAEQEVAVFREDKSWRAVADDRASLNADYLLQTSIDRFTAEYATEGAPPTIRVELHCLLVRRSDGALVGAFAANNTVQVRENRLASVVEGFSSAVNAALISVVGQADSLLSFAKVPAAP